MAAYHLAQVNIALPLEPVESALLAGFVEMLEPVNAVADAAPGFVWRLQTEEGDATAIRPFADERLMINMSVWESVETFAAFVYGPEHLAVVRQRRQWFVPMSSAYTVLWWVRAGSLPTPADAVSRLALLDSVGPTASAFTLRQPFAPPDSAVLPSVLDEWTCGV